MTNTLAHSPAGLAWAMAALLLSAAAPPEMSLDDALAVQPYPAAPTTPKQVLIRHATVWTMTEAGILEDTDVLIDNGTIAAIGRNLSAEVRRAGRRRRRAARHARASSMRTATAPPSSSTSTRA